MAATTARGSSWASGHIGAAAEAYATAIVTPDPSHICNLHHSLPQHWILNQLSEARDRTHILMDTSQIRFHCATMGTPSKALLNE